MTDNIDRRAIKHIYFKTTGYTNSNSTGNVLFIKHDDLFV